MSNTLRRLLLAAVFLIVFWLIWSRVHIVIYTRPGDWLVFLGTAAVLFLVLDHVLTHGRQ